MHAMDYCDCVEILRVYRKARPLRLASTADNRWHARTMASAADLVVRMAPGSCDISQDGDSLISILIAVPCDAQGSIAQSDLVENEMLADAEFQRFCAGANVIDTSVIDPDAAMPAERSLATSISAARTS